ncbi:hypothetical protein BDR07DRAFT_1399806 [Suillus spraguei]|nr:hypothetical protein BDR07DRAFT_1399806 [Suillus spraguei]
MPYHLVLTYVVQVSSKLYCFLDLDVLNLLHNSIPTTHHHPAFFTGFEILSPPVLVVQRLSCASITQQSSTFHIARPNVNASAREKRRPIIPSKLKKPAASTSCPPNSNSTQSSSAAQAQSFEQPQIAVFTSTASAPVPTPQATTSHTNPRVTIKNAGRWTRFWLFFCCTSPQYTHD